MTTLTAWVAELFASEWPGGLPDALHLTNRDDAMLLSVTTEVGGFTYDGAAYDATTYGGTAVDVADDYRSTKFDLSDGNSLGIALASHPRDPAGVGGNQYSREATLSVRIEGAHERQNGHVPDAATFAQWAETAQDVIEDADPCDAPGAQWHYLEPDAGGGPDMAAAKDYYRWDFDVHLRGYATR